MANNDRWRNAPERYGYRDDDRDRWRDEGSREGFGRENRGGAWGSREGSSDWGSRGGGWSGGMSREDQGGGGYGAERYGEAYRGGRDFGGGSRGDYGRGSDWDYGRRSGRDYGGGGSQRQFGGNDYSRRFYGADQGYGGRQDQDYGQRGERGFWERAGDEVSSWFGDDDAERRRRMDEQRGGMHRGRGPKGYTRSDDRIREDVNDRLSDDPFIDASEVEVSVSSCEVTLSGTVDSREAKRRAEDMAEQVSGVRHVQNNLRVQQQTIGMMGTTGMSGTTTGAAETTTASTGTTSASGKAGTTT
jgi:osmotically-inducible protein OsmY